MTAPTKRLLQTISFSGLAISVIPALLVYGGGIAKQTYLGFMLLGMFLWFGSAIFWIKKDDAS